MPNPGLSDEQCLQAVEALNANNGVKAYAARALGIPERTYTNRLKRAAERGLMGYAPVLPGFRIAKTTTVRDADGNTLREFISQKPATGETFKVPQGYKIKGESAYLDQDGRILNRWVKTGEAERDPLDIAKIIEGAFENFKPCAPAIIPAKDSDDDRLTAYIFCDWHAGLFAYGRETGGADWDLNIAKSVIGGAVREIVETSPPSAHAVILGLGDLLHADNGRNMTERSGNVLDVDTRYAKCLETVCDLLTEASEIIATKHKHVEAVFKPGNHDENSTTGIRQALRMYWRNHENVTVDTSPDPFYWRRFGVNLIGGTHGDKAKPKDMPLIMANRRKEDWAASKTRHAHTGHIHHDTLQEIGGVHVFSHRAPVAQDAYHAAHGYLSGRSMKSYTYHADKGARGHSEVEIG
jgi:hypothetical protein